MSKLQAYLQLEVIGCTGTHTSIVKAACSPPSPFTDGYDLLQLWEVAAMTGTFQDNVRKCINYAASLRISAREAARSFMPTIIAAVLALPAETARLGTPCLSPALTPLMCAHSLLPAVCLRHIAAPREGRTRYDPA